MPLEFFILRVCIFLSTIYILLDLVDCRHMHVWISLKGMCMYDIKIFTVQKNQKKKIPKYWLMSDGYLLLLFHSFDFHFLYSVEIRFDIFVFFSRSLAGGSSFDSLNWTNQEDHTWIINNNNRHLVWMKEIIDYKLHRNEKKKNREKNIQKKTTNFFSFFFFFLLFIFFFFEEKQPTISFPISIYLYIRNVGVLFLFASSLWLWLIVSLLRRRRQRYLCCC